MNEILSVWYGVSKLVDSGMEVKYSVGVMGVVCSSVNFV